MEQKLTLNQVADRLAVSYSKVHDLVRRGDLQAYRFGNAWRVNESAVEAYEQKSVYQVPVPKYRHRKIVTRIVDD